MDLIAWFQLWMSQVRETQPLEWIAVVTGIVEVLFALVNSVWLYPAGIISTAVSIYIMAVAGLYAESVLSVYYLVMSIYGWVLWAKPTSKAALPITYTSRREWAIVVAITVVGGLILYFTLHHFTNSTVPAWDAWVSATAWAGTWLLIKRKIENWLVLNVSNLFNIPLLVYKKLPLMAFLTLFLFIVAIFGYYKWKKDYSSNTAVA